MATKVKKISTKTVAKKTQKPVRFTQGEVQDLLCNLTDAVDEIGLHLKDLMAPGKGLEGHWRLEAVANAVMGISLLVAKTEAEDLSRDEIEEVTAEDTEALCSFMRASNEILGL